MEKIVITRAKVDDAEAILNLLVKMDEEDFEVNRDDEWKVRTFIFLQKGIEDQRACILIAKNMDGEIIGCCVGMTYGDYPEGWLQGEKSGYLRWLIVKPNYRNRGYGKELIEKLLTWFKEQNISTIQLHSSPKAKPLYKSFGFDFPLNENMWLVMKAEA